MFVVVSLHVKIRFTGHYAWPNFAGFKCPDFHIRWIQLVVELFKFFPKAAAKGSFKKSVVIKDCL